MFFSVGAMQNINFCVGLSTVISKFHNLLISMVNNRIIVEVNDPVELYKDILIDLKINTENSVDSKLYFYFEKDFVALDKPYNLFSVTYGTAPSSYDPKMVLYPSIYQFAMTFSQFDFINDKVLLNIVNKLIFT